MRPLAGMLAAAIACGACYASATLLGRTQRAEPGTGLVTVQKKKAHHIPPHLLPDK